MKKAFIAIAAVAFVATSCKKDYTCTCTDSSGDTVATYTATMKKKDAENWCNTWNTGMAGDGKCVLK